MTSTLANGSEGVSAKARGKRRATDEDADHGPDSSRAEVASKNNKRRREAKKLWQQSPTGPFLDPLAIASRSRIRIGDHAKPYLAPSARLLPFSRPFIEQVSLDVNLLCTSFEQAHYNLSNSCAARISNAPNSETARAIDSPLAILVRLWRKQGWHLAHLTWGEDALTRENFFEATSKSFLDVLVSLRIGDSMQSPSQAKVLRATACLFALLLLFSCQPTRPNPEPGIRKEAFSWAQKSEDADRDDWDPFMEHGWSRIKMEADIWETVLTLPQLYESKLSRDIMEGRDATSVISQSSDDLKYAISELWQHQGVHILPARSIAKGTRDPPYLPLYEEITQDERQRRSQEWGSVASSSSATHSLPGKDCRFLARSDMLLARAAQALSVPPSAFLCQTDVDKPKRLQFTPPTSQSATEAQKPLMSLFKGTWVDRPFRPLHLPGNVKWLGRGQSMDFENCTSTSWATISPSLSRDPASLAGRLQREKEEYDDALKGMLDASGFEHSGREYFAPTECPNQKDQAGEVVRLLSMNIILRQARARLLSQSDLCNVMDATGESEQYSA